MTNKKTKRIVTVAALIARINRKLKEKDEHLRTTRGKNLWLDHGDHYVVNVQTNSLVASHVNVEVLGRDLGVLKDSEQVEGAPSVQEYLVVTPLFEAGYGQPTTNFLRVLATSDVEAMCKATDIIGSEDWWEQVHGDDADACEDTLVGDPMLLKVTMDEPKPPLFEPPSAPLSIVGNNDDDSDDDSDDDAVTEAAE